MTSGSLVWVLTIPVVALYSWAMWVWAKLWLRIVATAVFVAFWFAAPAVTSVDVVWRFAMPATLVLAMLALLIRRPAAANRRGAKGGSDCVVYRPREVLLGQVVQPVEGTNASGADGLGADWVRNGAG